jgi:hypothetical protein
LFADGLKAAHNIHKENPKQEAKPTKGEEWLYLN